MSNQAQADYLTAQAEFADSMVKKFSDPRLQDSWRRVADSCRHLATFYRDGKPGKAPRDPEPG